MDLGVRAWRTLLADALPPPPAGVADPVLWGGPTDDERYLVTAEVPR